MDNWLESSQDICENSDKMAPMAGQSVCLARTATLLTTLPDAFSASTVQRLADSLLLERGVAIFVQSSVICGAGGCGQPKTVWRLWVGGRKAPIGYTGSYLACIIGHCIPI
jgi:hypothetical protein